MKLLVQHPPLRIITAFLAIVAGVSIQHLGTLGLLLLFGQGWLLLCRVPLELFWRRLRLILPFIFFSIFFFVLYEPGSVVVIFPWLTLSAAGLEKALIYSTRLVFSVQMLTLMFYEMPFSTFFQSLIRLKVPSIFAELILFTLRFMEVIRVEALTMLQAIKCRGMKPANFFSITYYLILSRLLGSLLVRSLNRSEKVYAGMMSRGYLGVVVVQERSTVQLKDWCKAIVWIIPVYSSLFIDLLVRR